MSAAPRVVLDTNVVLSALVFAGGHIAPIRHGWHDHRFEPLVSAATLAELARALAYPRFRLSAEEQQELLADYVPCCTGVKMPARLPTVPQCRDACDLAFLQLALTGKAEFLVTGDKDLLALSRGFPCPIVAPAEFLRRLNRHAGR